ncbi:MAG: response regulator transcription factor [Leptolyngbyaceae cyanobacterium bins.349]|nr:response regulator transcription factor [Leptolyngbyaceae cyanobacterium bins.349]
MVRILIIEDEINIAALLRTCVESEGYDCHVAYDGDRGLAAFRDYEPDVIILDLMLPKMDGLEVCTRIRQSGARKDPYIMMLTAKAEEIDRIIGFSTGADDYLPKPFSPTELLVRIRALLRRTMRHQAVLTIETTRLHIDLERRTVMVKMPQGDAIAVHLSSLEFDVLATLANRPKKVWTRPQLLDSVWGGDFPGDERIVDSYIKRLRQKLGQAHTISAPLIRTVPGVGYAFEDD